MMVSCSDKIIVTQLVNEIIFIIHNPTQKNFFLILPIN